MTTALKPVEWVGASRASLRAMPERVRDMVGYALYRAQQGRTAERAKRLKGFGPGLLEVVADHDRNAYRAVYTVRFAQAVYVLHVFQKKSKTGIATPKMEVNLVLARLKIAAEHYRTHYKEEPIHG